MADLIVEDFTGLTNSNVYASVEQFQEFAELNGIDLGERTDSELAIFLVRATNFIDSFENQMVGKRLNPEQSLAFPRSKSCKGNPHLYDMRGLMKALFYAVEAQLAGFSLLPIAVTKDDLIKKEKIEGLEVQYSEDLMPIAVLGKFPMIERYLTPYLHQIGYNVKVGR